MKSSKKHIEQYHHSTEKEQYNIECRAALETYLANKKKIVEDYQKKSSILHKGAVQTHSSLGRQLTESLQSLLYHDSYRMLARIIGLNGITDDVGTYIIADSPYNAVQPLISYPDLYIELERQHKNKECSALIADFYAQSSNQSSELSNTPKSLALNNHDMSTGHTSPWSHAFSISLTAVHGFRDHVHSVMAKYNIRLSKEHGWESMPLTKMHLYRSNHTGGSPLDQTPWGIVSKEYQDMMSVVCSAYYQRSAQLKKEHDDALLELERIYDIASKDAKERMIEKLHIQDEMDWEEINASITAESKIFSEQLTEPCQAVREQSNIRTKTPQKKESYQFFSASSKPKLSTIYEDQEENQNEREEDEDSEICAIFSSSIQLQKISGYR